MSRQSSKLFVLLLSLVGNLFSITSTTVHWTVQAVFITFVPTSSIAGLCFVTNLSKTQLYSIPGIPRNSFLDPVLRQLTAVKRPQSLNSHQTHLVQTQSDSCRQKQVPQHRLIYPTLKCSIVFFCWEKKKTNI